MPDLDSALAPLIDRPLAEPEPLGELERRARRIGLPACPEREAPCLPVAPPDPPG